MTKTAKKLYRKFKITDLGFGFWTRRLFLRYWCVTCVYRVSYIEKHSSRGTSLKFYRWRYWAILPHPLLKPMSDENFRHFWYTCKVTWLFEFFFHFEEEETEQFQLGPRTKKGPMYEVCLKFVSYDVVFTILQECYKMLFFLFVCFFRISAQMQMWYWFYIKVQ